MAEFTLDEWRKARFGYFDAGRFVEVRPPISIEEAQERHNCRWVGGDLDFELLQAVAPLIRRAALKEAAEAIKPKDGRPCSCDICYCGNSGDLMNVTAWDQQQADANAIRALAEKQP